ncbi:hypothetical protein ACP70R_004270 [Stipagrostis hirtigluma subsp. patula]
MLKHNLPISRSLPSWNQESKKPSMASPLGAQTCRSATGHDAAESPVPAAPEDFEFCILSSGGLALAGDDFADMCAADEVFSDGKLLPLRLSSANSADASTFLLLRSDSLDGAASAVSTSGFSSRYDSRSASSSSSSSSVSRSTSSKSASSDPAGLGSSGTYIRGASSLDAAAPRRRSLSSSVFYAHPSPSPRPPRRIARPAASAPRRSTGSAPPAAWGVIRLGVVGAPDVYQPRAVAESRRAAAAAARGGSQSARFEQGRAAGKEAMAADKKLALGLLGAGLVCSCSPDAVAPMCSAEAAAGEARRRRKKAEEKKMRGAKQSGQNAARWSRILHWLELSIAKDKNVV